MSSDTEPFVLTPMQEGMLSHSLRRSGVEVQQVLVRSETPFDRARLEEAWRWAVVRHPALRTAFRWKERDRAVQVIADPYSILEVPEVRLAGPFDAAVDVHLEADRDRERPMDEPFGGLQLLVADDGAALLWTHHHAHLDGRSIEIILADLLRRHDEGNAYAPPAAPSMRAHVAALEAMDTAASVRFFVEQLDGFREATPVPGRRPTEADDGTSEVRALASADTVSALRALGEEAGFTLANAVQLAWGVVLSRYAYTDDVVFGVTRSGRHAAPESRDVAGCLINTIPLRVRLPGERPVREVLQELRRTAIAARPHEHAPLSAIRTASDLETALFETVVVHERHRLDEVMASRRPEGAPVRSFSLRSQSEPPLTLALYEAAAGGLEVVIEYRPGVVDTGVAASLAPRVVRVLEQLAAEPGALVRDLRVTTDDEERPLTSGLALTWPDETPVAALGRVAQASPNREAIRDIASGRSLTFAQLHGAASALAADLRAASLSPGDVVAVHAASRPETVVAFWATQMAGVVYLPLDPSYPAERIHYVLEDSGAKALLSPPDAETLSDALPRLPVTLDATAAASGATTSEVAYMIYTSGSTGRPKGVRVGPAALMAHAAATIAEYGLTRHDRVLQFASPSFDVSLEEIVPTLLAGATLVIRDAEMLRSVAHLGERAAEHGVSVLQLPTAYFNELVHGLSQDDRRLPPGVRMLIIGGERASATSCRQFRADHPSVRLVNAYGPTEVTITSVSHSLAVGEDIGRDVPIGRPFGATTAFVLDRHGRSAPPGGRGHLVLGGPQLAIGYHGRDELTAERFAPRSAGEPRVYRTGDLVHADGAGNLVYDGRIDDQVKIRGYRVELGEIESALLADPAVAEAAVVVRTRADDRSLAAFLLHSEPLGVDAIRTRLAARLPPYMVPAAFVPLEEMPKTPGGKVDRRDLARREDEQPTHERPMSGMRVIDDPIVAVLISIFQEVLSRPVTSEGDFFDLGGHSLRAIRLAHTIQQRLGVELGAGAIFAHRTPRALAQLIDDQRGGGPRWELIQINDAQSDLTPLHCVVGVGVYRELGQELSSRPVHGVYVPEEEVVGKDEPIVTEDLAKSYVDAITEASGQPPRLICGVSYGGVVALEMAQQLRDAGAPPELVVMLDPVLPEMDERGGLDVVTNFVHRMRYQPEELPQRLFRRFQNLVGEAPPPSTPSPEQRAWFERRAAYTQALYDYVPRIRAYDGRSVLYVARDRLPSALSSSIDRWKTILGPFAHVEVVPGTHATILERPNIEVIAESLRGILARRVSMIPPAR